MERKDEESGYSRGMWDAWDIICEVEKLSVKEQAQLTNDTPLDMWVCMMSPWEAQRHLQEFKNRIMVGDVLEVATPSGNETCICTCAGEEKINVIFSDGTMQVLTPGAESVHKTGKRLPEIAKILEQIGGGDD